MFKKWPSEISQLSFLLWSTMHADVLDYRDLRWSSLFSPVDMSLAFVKDLKTQVRWLDLPEGFFSKLLLYFIYLFGFREFTHEARHNRDVKP